MDTHAEEKGRGVDVDVKVAGQEVSLKNVKSLNTIATVATLIIASVGLSVLWQKLDGHASDAKEASSAFVGAVREQTAVMKEQTQVAREQNCLIAMPVEVRRADPDACKRISR